MLIECSKIQHGVHMCHLVYIMCCKVCVNMCVILVNIFGGCIHAGSNGTVKLVMALVGKFAVAGSFAIIYLFSAELFPTTVR